MSTIENTGYNGWKNYETWAVKLWMDNDEGSYSFWRSHTGGAWQELPGSDSMRRKSHLPGFGS